MINIPPIKLGWIIMLAIDPLESFMFGKCSNVSTSQNTIQVLGISIRKIARHPTCILLCVLLAILNTSQPFRLVLFKLFILGSFLHGGPDSKGFPVFKLGIHQIVYHGSCFINYLDHFLRSKANRWIVIGLMAQFLSPHEMPGEVPYGFREIFHNRILALVLGITMLNRPIGLVPGMATPVGSSYRTNKGISIIFAEGMEHRIIGSTHCPLQMSLPGVIPADQFPGNFNEVSWKQDLLPQES